MSHTSQLTGASHVSEVSQLNSHVVATLVAKTVSHMMDSSKLHWQQHLYAALLLMKKRSMWRHGAQGWETAEKYGSV